MQRATSDFLQCASFCNEWRANFATSNEPILQRVKSDFLQRATSATSNERILQRVTSGFFQWTTSATSNERILQQVTSDVLQRVTSATVTSEFCNEKRVILQPVTSKEWISTSNNEWKVTPQKVHMKTQSKKLYITRKEGF